MQNIRRLQTKELSILAMLLAMNIVLTRFLSISAWNVRVGFGFVPVAMAGMLGGPLAGALVAALGDFFGAILFPSGPYFPGFTLTAFCTGFCLGNFHYQKQNLRRTVLSVLINQFVFGMLVNSFWISLLYHAPFFRLLPVRAVQAVAVSAAQISVLRLMVQIPKLLQRQGAI